MSRTKLGIDEVREILLNVHGLSDNAYARKYSVDHTTIIYWRRLYKAIKADPAAYGRKLQSHHGVEYVFQIIQEQITTKSLPPQGIYITQNQSTVNPQQEETIKVGKYSFTSL